MRHAFCFLLLTLCLTTSQLWARHHPHHPVPPPPSAGPPPAPRLMYHQDFEGYGQTAQDAEEHALVQAHDWMADNVPLGWVPPVEQLRERGLVAFDPPGQIELEQSGPMKVVKAHLQITQKQADDIQQVARLGLKKQRSKVAAQILFGMVALLLIGGGYLRLEEETRGYYTLALRLTAVSLLALVVMGICIVG